MKLINALCAYAEFLNVKSCGTTAATLTKGLHDFIITRTYVSSLFVAYLTTQLIYSLYAGSNGYA
jgi:hypothetical protein